MRPNPASRRRNPVLSFPRPLASPTSLTLPSALYYEYQVRKASECTGPICRRRAAPLPIFSGDRW
jgi:hypothetical protein